MKRLLLLWALALSSGCLALYDLGRDQSSVVAGDDSIRPADDGGVDAGPGDADAGLEDAGAVEDEDAGFDGGEWFDGGVDAGPRDGFCAPDGGVCTVECDVQSRVQPGGMMLVHWTLENRTADTIDLRLLFALSNDQRLSLLNDTFLGQWTVSLAGGSTLRQTQWVEVPTLDAMQLPLAGGPWFLYCAVSELDNRFSVSFLASTPFLIQ